MPTSDFHNITPLVSILNQLRPKRVLDVGCGFGKYGVLLREYLDIWDERLGRESWKVKIEGIEAFESYKNPIHDYAYDRVHYGDASDVIKTLGEFDAVLIIDVIEHLEMEKARALVAGGFARSPVVIVCTPRDFYAQHAICENPFEEHRCVFTRSDFPAGIHVKTVRVVACDIFVASREPLPKLSMTEPSDYIYLWSRKKLGTLGLPISLGLRALCRVFG
jgi:hypothetical protein